jgi:hypothetical protein
MPRRRLPPALLALAIAAVSTAALTPRPATAAPTDLALAESSSARAAGLRSAAFLALAEPVDYVIVVGSAGLRWDDVDQINTPTLWRMAEEGSIGSLSVRSAHQPTCPIDGWVTLGAGNYAAWQPGVTTGPCPSIRAKIEQRPPGAHLDEQRSIVSINKEKLPWGAVPGALAESVRCSAAVGPGAAVAAARPYGRVDLYEPVLPGSPAKLLESCVLSIVDAGAVAGKAAERRSDARRVDRALARVVAARPAKSLVLVAGVSDTDPVSRLHVAIAHGPGWERGWLTSASTGRDGYLQLVDLAPTVLAALGKPVPGRLFSGQSANRVPGRPDDLHAAVAEPADADREAGAQRRVAAWFFAVLTGVQVLLFVAILPLLRRARRHALPGGPPGVPRRLVAAVEVLLVAAALAIPAALVADAVPWWRAERAGPLFAAVLMVLLGLGTALVAAIRLYRRTLGPIALVAAISAVVVAADVLTGARLQLNGVAGYSALEGGRYAGLGTVGLGVLMAGALLTAGCLAQQVRRNWRPTVVALVGGMAVMVVGSPYLGADAVGAIALTAGVCIATALTNGGWLTFARLAWAALAGLAVTIGFALLDLRQPPEDRGSLGRFLTELGDGTGGLAMHRTGMSNAVAFGTNPLTLLAVLAALFVWLALLRPWGGLKRLYGLYPAVRAALAGIAVAALIAGVVGGAALNVAGAAAATAVPLAALAALRVLDHATDRTRPPVVPDVEPTEEPVSSAA